MNKNQKQKNDCVDTENRLVATRAGGWEGGDMVKGVKGTNFQL